MKAMQQELSSLHLVLQQSATEGEKQAESLSAALRQAREDKRRYVRTYVCVDRANYNSLTYLTFVRSTVLEITSIIVRVRSKF